MILSTLGLVCCLAGVPVPAAVLPQPPAETPWRSGPPDRGVPDRLEPVGSVVPDGPLATLTWRPIPPTPAQESVPASDPWLAEDKLRHFAMSFATTEMAYGAARMGLDREPALPLAAGVALAAGLGKELFDQRFGTGFSTRDLAWDLGGVVLGMVVAHQIR